MSSKSFRNGRSSRALAKKIDERDKPILRNTKIKEHIRIPANQEPNPQNLGFKYDGDQVLHVFPGSQAEKVGVGYDWRIISVNGDKISVTDEESLGVAESIDHYYKLGKQIIITFEGVKVLQYTQRQLDDAENLVRKKYEAQVEFDLITRWLNAGLAVWALAGIMGNIMIAEICFDDELLVMIPYDYCTFGWPLYIYTISCSILSLGFMFSLYSYKFKESQKMYHLTSMWPLLQYRYFGRTHSEFFSEFIILILLPWPVLRGNNPGHSGDYLWNLWLYVFISFRVYPAVRLLRDFSNLYKDRNTAHELRQKSNAGPHQAVTTGRVIKIYFLQNSFLMLGFLTAFFVLWCSAILYLIEREYWVHDDEGKLEGVKHLKDWDSPFNVLALEEAGWSQTDFSSYIICTWCCAITMMTVGYGDYYAISVPGRIFTMIIGFLGIFLTSLTVSALTEALANITPFERFLGIWVRKHSLEEEMKQTAIQLLEKAYICYKTTGGDWHRHKQNKRPFLSQARPLVKQIRSIKRVSSSFSKSKSVTDRNEVPGLSKLQERIMYMKGMIDNYVNRETTSWKQENNQLSHNDKQKMPNAKIMRKLKRRVHFG